MDFRETKQFDSSVHMILMDGKRPKINSFCTEDSGMGVSLLTQMER